LGFLHQTGVFRG